MIPSYEIILRLILASIIGGIIGFEREVHGRAAGFRTQLIVCVAAVLIMVVSENYYFYIRDLDNTLRIDPARISAGALIGIGFLGAGVIIKSGFAVRGLTTAASIWIVSAIGLAIGGGLYLEGIATSIITIIALVALRAIEKKIKVLRFNIISISTPDREGSEEQITNELSQYHLNVHSIDYERDRSQGEVTYRFTVSTREKDEIKRLFHDFRALEFVNTLKISG